MIAHADTSFFQNHLRWVSVSPLLIFIDTYRIIIDGKKIERKLNKFEGHLVKREITVYSLKTTFYAAGG